MKRQLANPSTAAGIGFLLTAPAAYFILISVLKYVFGWSPLFDAAEPFLNAWNFKETLGWNISLLILFGPAMALLLNLSAVRQRNNDGDGFHLPFALQHRMGNRMAIGFAVATLAVIFCMPWAKTAVADGTI